MGLFGLDALKMLLALAGSAILPVAVLNFKKLSRKNFVHEMELLEHENISAA